MHPSGEIMSPLDYILLLIGGFFAVVVFLSLRGK